jgi:hypothetical protein
MRFIRTSFISWPGRHNTPVRFPDTLDRVTYLIDTSHYIHFCNSSVPIGRRLPWSASDLCYTVTAALTIRDRPSNFARLVEVWCKCGRSRVICLAKCFDPGCEDCGPFGEVAVVGQVFLALMKQARRKAGAENAIDAKCRTGCAVLRSQLRGPCADPVGEFGVESIDERGVGGVATRFGATLPLSEVPSHEDRLPNRLAWYS